MKNLKQNKAITLVALVITIIILLILAGIAISQLTNSGLFNNTQTAKQEYANAQEREEDILKQYENAISTGEIASTRDDDIPKAREIDLSTLDANAKGQIVVNNKTVTICGSVEKTVTAGGVILTIPNDLKPSSNKYGIGTMWNSTNGLGSGQYLLNASGELINPSTVTRTEFYFSITYVLP